MAATVACIAFCDDVVDGIIQLAEEVEEGIESLLQDDDDADQRVEESETGDLTPEAARRTRSLRPIEIKELDQKLKKEGNGRGVHDLKEQVAHGRHGNLYVDPKDPERRIYFRPKDGGVYTDTGERMP